MNIKLILIIAGVFIFGVALGATAQPPAKETVRIEPQEVVKEKIVYKTPISCSRALEIDNNIFSEIASSLGTMDFDSMATYVETVTPERTKLYQECTEGI